VGDTGLSSQTEEQRYKKGRLSGEATHKHRAETKKAHEQASLVTRRIEFVLRRCALATSALKNTDKM